MADEVLTCPGCGKPLAQAGYTDRCPGCDGAWIHEDALVGMLQERTSALVVLPWQPRPKDNERSCAVCRTPMQTVNLGSVALDRCADHGVWFDADELAALLAQAKTFKSDKHEPSHEHTGLLGALAKLFGG
ncbi:MAG: zf-TFIIB domain-containing protein [Kofleriaceae bacterium]